MIIVLNNAIPIGYYLREEKAWSIDPSEIPSLIQENTIKNKDINALVVINPDNPTGGVLA